MKKRNAILAMLLVVCTLFGMTACQSAPGEKQKQSLTVEPPKAANDYAEVVNAMMAPIPFGVNGTADTMEYSAESANMPTLAAADAAAPDYSGTNVQVEGIDEADIVKTDGKYIYAICGNLLTVYRADGENSERVSETTIAQSDENITVSASELYLDSGRLFVITERSVWGDDDVWYCKTSAEVLVYDVSKPEKPALKETYGQDGNYSSSRLTDGMLFVITEHYLYDETFDTEDWVPITYCSGTETKVPANRIYICPGASTCLTMVGAFNCKTLKTSDVCSFTGHADTVYMNGNEIYIAQTNYDTIESDPYTVDQYEVVDYENATVTAINRVTAKDGKLTLTATGSVEGYLVNQFAIDSYNGNLRVASTVSNSSYSIYTDKKHDFENYKWGDGKTENRMTVLGSDLQPIGTLDGIAPDERIYSVRYFGDVAYVVTYESIDPVFAIDLSNPSKPTLLSALEVLGVSDYLHGYGDGLLFGLGQALDENGASDGLQLSMFDVSDPKNVKLVAKTEIDESYSEALYNHKAILIDPEKNLIGFPGSDRCFYVFSYKGSKFKQEAKFDLAVEDDGIYWNWNTTRGLYIDSNLYLICDGALCVVSMKDYSVVKVLNNVEG